MDCVCVALCLIDHCRQPPKPPPYQLTDLKVSPVLFHQGLGAILLYRHAYQLSHTILSWCLNNSSSPHIISYSLPACHTVPGSGTDGENSHTATCHKPTMDNKANQPPIMLRKWGMKEEEKSIRTHTLTHTLSYLTSACLLWYFHYNDPQHTNSN